MSDDLLKGIDRVEQLVIGSMPGPSEDGLRQCEELCKRIEFSHLADAYAKGKARSLRSHVRIYFSERKHRQWPEGAVRQFILADCLTLRMVLEEAIARGDGS